MGTGETGVGEIEQIIDETGVCKTGEEEMGVNRFKCHSVLY